MQGEKCVDCRHLETAICSDRKVYRCGLGLYDRDGLRCYYVLSGITRPNQAVREIQADCVKFERGAKE